MFNHGDLSTYLDRQAAQAARDVASLSLDQLKHAAQQNQILDRYRAEPVVLDKGAATTTFEPIDGKPLDLRCKVVIPFTGTTDLFNYQPSTTSSVLPHAQVDAYERVVVVQTTIKTSTSQDQIRTWRSRELTQLEQWLGFVNAQSMSSNERLSAAVENAAQQRREQLRHAKDLGDALGPI